MLGFPSARPASLAIVLAIVLVVAWALLGATVAQTFHVAASVGTSPEARIGVRSVPRGADELDAALIVAADPGAELTVRRSQAFGPLGTLVLEADASARFAATPAARLGAAARGVLGPVAASLRASAWGAPPERFLATAGSGRAPFDRGVSLALAGEGRLDRTWLLAGGATGWRGDGGRTALDLDVRLRGRRALGDDLDLTVRAHGRLAGRADGRAALGAGIVVAPRRAPEIAATAWLDAAPTADGVRVVPGLSSEGAWALGSDRLAWTAVARPGGSERSPWSLDASWRRPAWDGTVEVRAGARAGGDPGTGWSVGIVYRRELAGPAWRDRR
ncbi:MAG: hypothetical protein U5J97_07060 [Trueperaceae bacterium]|nr:hypothetical protein [Trueperaceae bacterium]